MDGLNQYGLAFGVTIAILSAVFSFFNRERYKTLIKDIYQPGNDELRSQLASARQENTELDKERVASEARYTEQQKRVKDLEQLNSRLPDFTSLSKTMTNNHTEVITLLTSLTKVIVEKGEAHGRRPRIQRPKSSSTGR